MEKIILLTSDGVKIVGNWAPAGSKGAILLLHMRPATKESWSSFMEKLNGAGFSALAVDLRGHGESVEKGSKIIDYNNFPDGSHAECRLDVDAALEFLKSKGEIIVIGGSIGANLAIDALARHPEIKKGAAFSPGLEYLGVETENAIKTLKTGQKLLLVASRDDEYSYDSVLKLQKLNPQAEIKLYENAGHATKMFDKEPELMDVVIEFISNYAN